MQWHLKKNLRYLQCASSIQSLSAPSTKWTSLCLMLSLSQKQGGALIKNVGNHPVGIFGRWYRDLCECLCCSFFEVVFVRAEMDSGVVKGLALAFEMDFGVCQSSWILVFGLWVVYHAVLKWLSKLGMGNGRPLGKQRISAVNCICSTSLVNLQGPMSPCSLNGCGPAVLFPHGSCVCTCLHSLQDGYRRVSGVYLPHSVRLHLEGNISAAIAAQLSHQHVPETERPDLWLPLSRSLSSFQLTRQGRSQGFFLCYRCLPDLAQVNIVLSVFSYHLTNNFTSLP